MDKFDSNPVKGSSLKVKDYVLLKNRPCKILEMSSSKTGKHGHAKIHFVGLDLFTQKKIEDFCPSKHQLRVPRVEKKEYQVMYRENSDVYLRSEGETDLLCIGIGDLALKEQMEKYEQQEGEIMCTVLCCGDEEAILSIRQRKN